MLPRCWPRSHTRVTFLATWTMQQQRKRAREPMNRSTRISKEMSKILRHQPPPGMDSQGSAGMQLAPQQLSSKLTALSPSIATVLGWWYCNSVPVIGAGFVTVEELRAHMKSKPTVEEIKAVVADCSKVCCSWLGSLHLAVLHSLNAYMNCQSKRNSNPAQHPYTRWHTQMQSQQCHNQAHHACILPQLQYHHCCLQQRFVLEDSGDELRVRAAQGHSVQLEAPVLQPVTDAAAVPCAIHATSKEG